MNNPGLIFEARFMLQFRTLTADLVVTPTEKLLLEGNMISAFVKLMYAFLWQEAYIRPPFVTNPAANAVGAELIPLVNSFANQFNDFTYYEQTFQARQMKSIPDPTWIWRCSASKWKFQDGYAIYPGDGWCNRQYPHAKWHLQSGVGLLDLVYICDNILNLTALLTK